MVTSKEITYISCLARINLTQTEIDSLSENMENILGYIAQLETLDVNDIKPTSHVLPLKNVYREDMVTSCFTREQAMSIAVASLNGFFKVPQIIE
ncbi:MAG: Asp-tRNA(Asn)/Glu-tRNA(Gln) amidotransferase subunit GatC [Candidatus Omnitrophota bacterium]